MRADVALARDTTQSFVDLLFALISPYLALRGTTLDALAVARDKVDDQ